MTTTKYPETTCKNIWNIHMHAVAVVSDGSPYESFGSDWTQVLFFTCCLRWHYLHIHESLPQMFYFFRFSKAFMISCCSSEGIESAYAIFRPPLIFSPSQWFTLKSLVCKDLRTVSIHAAFRVVLLYKKKDKPLKCNPAKF